VFSEVRRPDRRSLLTLARPIVTHIRSDPRATRWEREVERFLSWKRTESSVGEGWVRRMRWELLRFPDLLRRVGLTPIPEGAGSVTPEMVSALRRGLPWEKATVALQYAALRQFLAWKENPIAARRGVWTLPSGDSTHRRWITQEQLLRLFRASREHERLLIALEGLNGLRRVEVLRLRAKDVALDEGCLNVLGKGRNGGKWRKIPMFPSVRPILESAVRGLKPTDRLIALSNSGADQLLSRAVARAGLRAEGVRVSHHDLRRTFGRLAHGAGIDLIQLKNLFGHASVEMSVRYVGLDADSMRAGLERMSQAIGPLS